MANVILPITYLLLSLGRTIDLRDYSSITDYRLKSIYDLNQTNIVETPVDELTSTYYVLPDENIPYAKFGVPIDLILRNKAGRIYNMMLDKAHTIWSSHFDSAAVLLVTEYRKIDQSIKENAFPISGWQDKSNVPKAHTHYIDKMHFGGRSITFISFRSDVKGDVQIFRRILREVMGESGSVGKDTIDLWRKALRAVKESEDVRGEVHFVHNTMTSFVELPSDAFVSVEKMLQYLNEFPKYVKIRDLHGPLVQLPIYLTFKPLHELDERYPSLQKNVLAEKYFYKLKGMYSDLEYAKNNLRDLSYTIDSDEDYKKITAFSKKLKYVRQAVGPLTYSDLSIYKDINVTEFENAFERYQDGLDNSVENYYTDYKRLKEQIGVRCENGFLKPTRGSLIVESNEVLQKDRTDLAGCQDICIKDERCRAIGYAAEKERCWIYYRSTSSAKILSADDNSRGFKVFDRKCH